MNAVFLVALFGTQVALLGQSIFVPVADGSVNSYGVYPSSDVIAGDGLEGDLQFASFNSTPYTSILLELNPYAEPLFASTLYVFGFDNASGVLSGSDYNAGTYIGTWTIPLSLGYGQETFFDVTSFVKSATGSFFGFELRAPGLDEDDFSSTGQDIFPPPELIASIPEPPSSSLIGLAASIWAVLEIRSRVKSCA